MGAGWGRDPMVGLKAPKIPQNLKIQKKFVTRVFHPIFCRLFKDPKRLGLGQKVPGKHPLGQTSRDLWAQKHRSLEVPKWAKNGNFGKTFFRVLAIKWAKHGVFFIVGYI